METERTIYLIDGTAYIHRAYHAIRGLSNSRGFPTNAVFGFARMLIKLIEDRNPQYAAMLFDARGPTFRHEIYADYKANRPPMPDDMALQIPHIKDLTAGFNLAALEMPGYEADDLIGTLARRAVEQGFRVIIVTGDKDFMQLVSDRITIWDPMKEATIDVEHIRANFGVHPHQMVHVMGLSGDAADNVPGVPGIGPKTARKLIQKFETIEGIYAAIDHITSKKQHDNLVRYREQAFLSRKLVIIDTAVPLSFEPEAFRVGDPDRPRLAGLFKTLEFRQLQQAYPEASDLSRKAYRAVQEMADLEDLVRQLQSAELIALDTETTSERPMRADLVGLSFAMTPHEAFYIPCAHTDPNADRQLPLDEVLGRLKPLLENPNLKKGGQNIKYDWMVLARHGVELAGVVFDTMLASYLINPSKRAHSLDQIALDFLDHKTITYAEVTGKGKNALRFDQVPLSKAVPYACEDADITLMAHQELMPRVAELGLGDLYEHVEMPLIPVLMRMEMQGVCVDRRRLRELSESFAHQLDLLQDEIYASAGERFNIKSSQQLGNILFEKLNLPVQKKTKKKTGYSTDVDVLTTLAEHHQLPALVLRHRTLAKLKSTYTDALLELINPRSGRIHTSYNQTVTATGRLSSSDPNLQNIPIRTQEGREIRSAFVPRPGWQMVSADYSQIELRILAHCSDDPILIEAFRQDEDIHSRTAAEIFQIHPSLMTAELRRHAKIINFGIIYGMSAFSLSKELGISQKMAKTYIDNYFNRYSGVRQFIDRTIEEARQTRRTSTLLQRIRLLPDIGSTNRNVRQFAERTAVNTPIQGTAADLIKVAMIKMDEALKTRGFEAAMLLTVHDELVFEVPPGEVAAVSELVKDEMEHVWDLTVPLKVNLAVGSNWAEAH